MPLMLTNFAVDVLFKCPVLFCLFRKERRSLLQRKRRPLDPVALGQVQTVCLQCDSAAHCGIYERPKSERFSVVNLQRTSMVPSRKVFSRQVSFPRPV